MPSTPETSPHTEEIEEVTNSPLPLFGEIFDGERVDINFIETYDYYESSSANQESLIQNNLTKPYDS